MMRPIKWRKTEHIPLIPYFISSETIVAEFPENILMFDEKETIRLKE